MKVSGSSRKHFEKFEEAVSNYKYSPKENMRSFDCPNKFDNDVLQDIQKLNNKNFVIHEPQLKNNSEIIISNNYNLNNCYIKECFQTKNSNKEANDNNIINSFKINRDQLNNFIFNNKINNADIRNNKMNKSKSCDFFTKLNKFNKEFKKKNLKEKFNFNINNTKKDVINKPYKKFNHLFNNKFNTATIKHKKQKTDKSKNKITKDKNDKKFYKILSIYDKKLSKIDQITKQNKKFIKKQPKFSMTKKSPNKLIFDFNNFSPQRSN